MAGKYVSVRLMGLAAAAWVMPIASNAQQATTQEIMQAPTGGLEEVIVTAQKRQENVQQVPIAIEAFNEHMMDAMQISSIDSLAQFAPGLNIARNSNTAYISLRGVILTGTTVGIDSTVGIYVDGVYRPSGSATTAAYNNFASVEVDKGPQGTLFGRNAVGGVINITTKDPTQTPHIDFALGYANYNTVSGDFYGTTGIAPNLAADLSIHAYNQGTGWGTDSYTGQPTFIGKEWAGRSKWLFTPVDGTRLTFIADYDRNWFPEDSTVYTRGANADISPAPTTGPLHVGGFYDAYGDLTPSAQNTQYGLSLKIEHDFGWAQGVSISAWRRNKNLIDAASMITIFPNQGLPGTGAAENNNNTRQITSSQEFQLLSPTSSVLKWIGGIFLYQDESSQDPYVTQYLNAVSPTTYNYTQQNTTSYAAFGQATAPIYPDTRLTLGYRYTIDNRSIHGTIWSIVRGAGVPTTTGSQSKRWPKATYKLALDHDFSANILGYASYSRGFESGAFNVISGPTAPAVNPETLDSYEIGVKSDLSDHTVRLNASLFYYDFRNLIVSQHIESPPATVTTNAAEAQFKGIDLDVTVAPLPNLTMQAGMELLSPYYKSFPNATVFIPNPANPLAATTATGNDTGNQVAYSETSTANVNAQYRIPTSIGDFRLVGDVTYHSGLMFDPQNAYRQNPYFLANASVMWTAPSGMWDTKIWVTNLTGLQLGTSAQIGSPPDRYEAAQPRLFGIKVGYHWN